MCPVNYTMKYHFRIHPNEKICSVRQREKDSRSSTKEEKETWRNCAWRWRTNWKMPVVKQEKLTRFFILFYFLIQIVEQWLMGNCQGISAAATVRNCLWSSVSGVCQMRFCLYENLLSVRDKLEHFSSLW